MRLHTFPLALAAIAVLISCGGDNVTSDPTAPVPAAVSCGDARQLRQQAADGRRRVDQLTSDQEKIDVGNRAGFLASLAIVADLKCKVVPGGTDEALKPALEAARKAEGARSFYESTVRWGEANFIASQVITQLIEQLPAPPK